MWAKTVQGSAGGSAVSGKIYAFSWNSQNYVCALTASDSSDILATFIYNNTSTSYEDENINVTMTGTNKLKAVVKKACTLITYNQTTKVETAKSANDVAINEVFNIGCAFIKFG